MDLTGGRQIQASRNSYLSQYMQEVREGLVELALSEEQLAASRPSDWWFEDTSGGGRARWCVPARLQLEAESLLIQDPLMPRHWPIGLIYDHSSINNANLSSSLPPTNPYVLRLCRAREHLLRS